MSAGLYWPQVRIAAESHPGKVSEMKADQDQMRFWISNAERCVHESAGARCRIGKSASQHPLPARFRLPSMQTGHDRAVVRLVPAP